MTRVNTIQPDKASSTIQDIYRDFEKKLGRVPNIFLNMGNSAAVLKGYIALNQAANETSLEPKVREQIALAVSQTNQCQYCLSAHTTIGKGAGLKDLEMIQARQGQAQDPKIQSILKFVKTVTDNRGHVNNQDVASLKAAGVTDQELTEIVLVIIETIFTNYFNNITDPKIDFPLAPNL
jgi:uncharacterized peroxidase-related enzyme